MTGSSDLPLVHEDAGEPRRVGLVTHGGRWARTVTAGGSVRTREENFRVVLQTGFKGN